MVMRVLSTMGFHHLFHLGDLLREELNQRMGLLCRV